MSSLHLQRVWKIFNETPAVRDVSIDVPDGEFLVMVGPSGCGKTTILRMLAGLETPTYGRIAISDRDVTLTPPGDRDVAMVFQSYALYPHMSVYKNLAFGPRVRHESKQKTRALVNEVAEILGLRDLLERRPSELSGGQRQRVALGRVMIRQPSLFLLDEPLSNLDAALRVQMRAELIKLQRRLKVTTVYVTHDQVEAMTMGDRIAVINQGQLLQIDTPTRLYEQPETLFAATFIGSPKMNVLAGEVHTRGAERYLRCLGMTIPLPPERCELMIERSPLAVAVGIRPYDLFLTSESPARCTVSVEGVVDVIEPTGPESFVLLNLETAALTARIPRSEHLAPGTRLRLSFDPSDLHLFDAQSEKRVIRWQSETPTGVAEKDTAGHERVPS